MNVVSDWKENVEIISKVTRAVRCADEKFKTTGGSSRHWVTECFLEFLEDEGLVIFDANNLMDLLKKMMRYNDDLERSIGDYRKNRLG